MSKLRAAVLSLILGFGLTAATANAQQAPVNLASNSTFAILAGTTVTVTGGGTITGNVGIFPGTGYVPGTPAVTVIGTVYAGGPIAAQAQSDLTAAFNDAAGRTLAPITVSGNIGGMTLAPGLYKSTSSLAISSGDLTLDAGGNPNAVWIFQIASTLTTTSGRQVILAGGANPANIFWQVGSSATLGTTSVFQGNILAGVSISMLTGSRLAGRALAMGGAVSIDTGGGTSTIVPAAPAGPTVTSTVPVNGATSVPLGNRLSAAFSTTMNAATITTATFTLAQGATPVAGTVTYIGTTATFTPSSNLSAGATYTATITTGAKDLAGNALASNYVWSFTAGSSVDFNSPTVTFTVPATGATGVPIGNKLFATFSTAMNPATLTSSSFTVTGPSGTGGTVPIAGTVTYTGLTASFAPTTTLTPGVQYTATITTAAQNLAGTGLAANYVWSFSTGTSLDTTPPTVTSTVPASLATGVQIGSNLTATFSEPIDPLTITTATFTLQQGATPVSGTVIYNGTTAVFTPLSNLAPNTVYTATFTNGVKDLAGNALAPPYVWNFTTGGTATIVPVVNSGGTVSAASYTSPVAAGSIAAVFGSNLALGGASAASITPLPTTLGGSSSQIGGRAAPLFFVSPFQVNLQIPWELAGQTQAAVVTTVSGAASVQQNVNLVPFAPGIFAINQAGSGQGAVLISGTSQLAAPGTAVARGLSVSIFATGLGAVSNQPVTGAAALAAVLSNVTTMPTVSIGGVVANVSFAGLAPGFVGLYQVNAVVPTTVSPGNTVPVIISVGSVSSNTVTIAVQ